MIDSALGISQYKWGGLSTLDMSTSRYQRCRDLLSAIDWVRLKKYASELQGGESCQVEEPVALGGRHIVRILTFTGGQRWVARFRIPGAIPQQQGYTDDILMRREVHCLKLMAERTSVSVPRVLGFYSSGAGIGAAVIPMECLPGNCAMDIHFNFIPQPFKHKFFKEMANAQAQTCSILLPRIGMLILLEDGNIEVGSIPGIGGPFDTASAFLRAWAVTAKFPTSKELVMKYCGSLGDEVWQSLTTFPEKLVHVDYGHNNIVVDPNYNVLGVIDWEHAIASPWQTVGYPLTVRVTPKPVDTPELYNSDGSPKDGSLKQRYEDRREYVQAVIASEAELSLSSSLSEVLLDEKIQNVAAAMKLFTVDGKMGFYSRVLEAFESNDRQTENSDGAIV